MGLVVVVGRVIPESKHIVVTVGAAGGVLALHAGFLTGSAQLLVESCIVVALHALAQVGGGVIFPQHDGVAAVASGLLRASQA